MPGLCVTELAGFRLAWETLLGTDGFLMKRRTARPLFEVDPTHLWLQKWSGVCQDQQAMGETDTGTHA